MQSDKILALTGAANVELEPIWATLLAKALEGKDVKELLSNVGAGGAGPAAAAAPAAGGAAAAGDAPKEEEKEEEKEESDDDMVRSLTRLSRIASLTTRSITGLRSLRLSVILLRISLWCLSSYCIASSHAPTILTALYYPCHAYCACQKSENTTSETRVSLLHGQQPSTREGAPRYVCDGWSRAPDVWVQLAVSIIEADKMSNTIASRRYASRPTTPSIRRGPYCTRFFEPRSGDPPYYEQTR